MKRETKKWNYIQAYLYIIFTCMYICMCVYIYRYVCVYLYFYLSTSYIWVKSQCSKIPIQEVRNSIASLSKVEQ